MSGHQPTCIHRDRSTGRRLHGATGLFAGLSMGLLIVSGAMAKEWEQWRGPARNGSWETTVQLIDKLPEEGLKPTWVNTEDVGGGGGWSSPVVADGKVFSYIHKEVRRENVELPPPEYPKLSAEEEQALGEEKFRDYEEMRRQENMARREKLYQFIDRVVSLDAADGELVWEFERDSEQTRWRQSSTPAVADGKLYFLSADRRLVCLDASNGNQLWVTSLPVDHDERSPISSSPLVIDDQVFVLAENLIAFATSTGAINWKSEASQEGSIYSSPVAWTKDGTTAVIVNLDRDETLAFDSKTGSELWSVESLAGRSSPIVVDDKLVTYGSSRKGGVRCFQLGNGKPELLWMYRRLADQGSSPVVVKDRVYVQGETTFACVDLQTGDEIWRTQLDLDRPRYTSPIAVGDRVFYTFGGLICVSTQATDYSPLMDARLNNDYLLAETEYFQTKLNIAELEKQPGGYARVEELWKKEITAPRSCVSPALVEGRLYLRLNHGLACYDLRKE